MSGCGLRAWRQRQNNEGWKKTEELEETESGGGKEGAEMGAGSTRPTKPQVSCVVVTSRQAANP